MTAETERASPPERPGRRGRKRRNVGGPKLVVKLATQIATDKNGERETTTRRRRGRPPTKGKGTPISHEEENGGVEDIGVLRESDTVTEEMEPRGGRPVRRRNRKFMWNLALIKRRGRISEKGPAGNLGRGRRKGCARSAESGNTQEEAMRDKLAIIQVAPGSPEPDAKKPKAHNVLTASLEGEEKQENAVSLDSIESARVEDSTPHSPKLSSRAFRRRKSLFGYRRKPAHELLLKMRNAQSPAEEKIPRKRRKLVCYTYEAVDLPGNEEKSLEPLEQGQQGLTDNLISGRPSRVIRVPKRFMDDEGPPGPLGKKVGQSEHQEEELCSDSEKPNLFQALKVGSKQKSASKRSPCDDEENLVGKSVELKPIGLTGAPQRRVGRPAYDSTSLKIYERLKMLTASLTQRKEQRMASSHFKTLGEKEECESHGAGESLGSTELRKWGSSDIKIADLNCSGVVHKVAIHTDDQVIGQAALSSVEALETKADGENYGNAHWHFSTFASLTTLYFFPAGRTFLQGATDAQSTDAAQSEAALAQSGSIHKVNISGANKRMLHLLKRAKVQLIKIDQQKQMKTAQVSLFLFYLLYFFHPTLGNS